MLTEQFKDSRALHDVINLVIENAYMQTMGIDVGIPYICGAPGGGKTASLHYLSKLYGFGVISTHLALKPLEETGGIPQFDTIDINGEKKLGTIWSFPDIMKQLYELSNIKKKEYETALEFAKKNNKEEPSPKIVLWLIDDAHLLTPTHQALLYELFTERTLRGYRIPDNCAMVMAGNTSNKSGSKSMFSAIINRVQLMPVHTDFDSWKNNFALKPSSNIHPAIISFLTYSQYRKYFHEDEQVDIAWGSPRSWTRFGTVLSVYEGWHKSLMPSHDCLYVGTGYIGLEGASDFTSFYKIYSEFDIPSIINDYANYVLPDNPVKRYALAYALITYYSDRNDRNKILPAISHILTLYYEEAPELAIMMAKEIHQIGININKKKLLFNIMMEMQKSNPSGAAEIMNLLKDITDSAI